MSMLLTPEEAREAKVKHPGASELWGRPAKIVMDDWSKAKAHEDCTPFTFTLKSYTKPEGTEWEDETVGRYRFTDAAGNYRYGYTERPNTRGQEKFVKGLNTLMAKQAREATKRAKIAAKVAA